MTKTTVHGPPGLSSAFAKKGLIGIGDNHLVFQLGLGAAGIDGGTTL